MRSLPRLVASATPLAVLLLTAPLPGQSSPRADTSARPMEPVARVPVGPVAGTRPTYPPMLRSAGWEGTVVADVMVDSSGLVVLDSFHVLQRTHELFAATTRKVVATWRFEPATMLDSVAGLPRMRAVAAHARVTVSYRLVSDSTALDRCHAVAPVTRVCAPQEKVIRTRFHE